MEMRRWHLSLGVLLFYGLPCIRATQSGGTKTILKKTIKESYKNRIGQTVSVEFKENNLFSKDLTSETSIDYIEFKDLVNLRDHYLLRLQNDLTIVIPKHAIEDVSFLPTLFDQLGKPVVDEINWVWK